MQSEPRPQSPDRRAPGETNGQPPLAGRADDARNPHGDDQGIPADLPEITGRGATLIGVVILVLLGGFFLLGWMPHSKRTKAAQADADEAMNAKPVVSVIAPKRSAAALELLLPADVQAYQSTALFARTSGYLKPFPDGIDIGARVKAGQLLAEIAAPEVDAELDQAKAGLQLANVTVGRATNEYNFAKGTFERYSGLSESGGVTQQQLDEKRSAFNISNSSLKAATANVAAAEASVKRLTESQGFQKIVAPFDGVITARNYDPGALISATASGGGNRELFRIAQADRLRVFVNVPQAHATAVKPDHPAELIVRNYPNQPFPGRVARTAGVIDPATRTLRVEVEVPNAEGKLFAGMWGQIKFKIQQETPPLVVPTSALTFGPDGTRVAIVEAREKGDTVRFQDVTLGRDFGNEAEVASGLSGGERVVSNPGERLGNGVEVQVAPSKEPPKPTTGPHTQPAGK